MKSEFLDRFYASQVNMPKTFQELATGAHDMELTTTYYGRRLTDDDELTFVKK